MVTLPHLTSLHLQLNRTSDANIGWSSSGHPAIPYFPPPPAESYQWCKHWLVFQWSPCHTLLPSTSSWIVPVMQTLVGPPVSALPHLTSLHLQLNRTSDVNIGWSSSGHPATPYFPPPPAESYQWCKHWLVLQCLPCHTLLPSTSSSSDVNIGPPVVTLPHLTSLHLQLNWNQWCKHWLVLQWLPCHTLLPSTSSSSDVNIGPPVVTLPHLTSLHLQLNCTNDVNIGWSSSGHPATPYFPPPPAELYQWCKHWLVLQWSPCHTLLPSTSSWTVPVM